MAATDSLVSAGKQAMSALSEGLNRLLGRRLPAILNIAALLVLTGSSAQWTWKLVQPPLPVIPQKSDSVQTSATSFDLQGLLAAHLFGRAAAPAPAAPTPAATIPTSTLDLVLTGVVAGATESYALIRVNNEPETPFALGDEIAHGVSLHAVHPDRAIIERRGSKEALLLEDKTAGAIESPVVASAPSTRRPAGIVERAGDDNFTVNRELVSQELRNPELFRQALIVPNAGGGFLVRQIQSGSLYEKLGLRVGDVIRKVNGRDLNSVDEALRLYQQIGGIDEAAEIELEVLRGGRPQQLRYTVQ